MTKTHASKILRDACAPRPPVWTPVMRLGSKPSVALVMAGGAEGLGGGGAGGPSGSSELKGLRRAYDAIRSSRNYINVRRADHPNKPPPRPTPEDIDAQAQIDYQNDLANAEQDENLDDGAIEDYDSADGDYVA
ncbi:hypothetical protein GGX14DRAFT_576407 [Mycena pura]|uniref:Uncharacterized protein n=1 Tax=Mycena pura TaxID=153505 RepID=A0AAD6Y513_9AGAR|nr:hypothetical protein GGX14DRAFT_576407 [Mycena pura]